jgi:hypothetical protein
VLTRIYSRSENIDDVRQHAEYYIQLISGNYSISNKDQWSRTHEKAMDVTILIICDVKNIAISIMK